MVLLWQLGLVLMAWHEKGMTCIPHYSPALVCMKKHENMWQQTSLTHELCLAHVSACVQATYISW